MKALTFTPAAEADINGIWEYSFEGWGLAQAERYITEIRDTCRVLAAGQKEGRVVNVRPGYLKYPSGAHMIYFRDHGDRLEIVRILHGKQDVQRHLMH